MTNSTHQTSLFEVTGKTVTVWADESCQNVKYPDAIAGYGCLIKDGDSGELEEIQGQVEYDGRTTPLIAEYKAIINGIESVCKEYSSVGVLHIYSDGESTVEQIGGDYNIVSPALLKLKNKAHRLLSEFDEWHIDWQSKTESREIRRANALAEDTIKGDDQ